MEWAWHVHHDIIVEPLTEPIEVRQQYIRDTKPTGEVETRLRLLRRVKGQLPEVYIQAGEVYVHVGKVFDQAKEVCDQAEEACVQEGDTYNQARDVYVQAEEVYDHAGEVCDQVGAAYEQEINELHRLECPNCPWDGRTIFPQQAQGR